MWPSGAERGRGNAGNPQARGALEAQGCLNPAETCCRGERQLQTGSCARVSGGERQVCLVGRPRYQDLSVGWRLEVGETGPASRTSASCRCASTPTDRRTRGIPPPLLDKSGAAELKAALNGCSTKLKNGNLKPVSEERVLSTITMGCMGGQPPKPPGPRSARCRCGSRGYYAK